MGGKGLGGRGAAVPGECRGIGRMILGGSQRSGRKEAGECQGTGRLEELSKEERSNTNCILMMGRKRYVMNMRITHTYYNVIILILSYPTNYFLQNFDRPDSW